ncbi:MAG: RNA polymerase sigma factor, partial [Rhodothermales bacterium]
MVPRETLLRGNLTAFEHFVCQESSRLHHVLVRIVRDEDAARRVLVQTFLQAYERRRTFRRERKLTTWLYAIGIKRARAALGASQREDTPVGEDIERLQPGFADGMHVERYEAWKAQKLTDRAERKRVVCAALDRLPLDYRLVVTLRDIEEFSAAEIARILDIREGTVRLQIHRARQAL